MVTGGVGFEGYHLFDRLLKERYDVLSVNYFYSGTMDNIAKFHRKSTL